MGYQPQAALTKTLEETCGEAPGAHAPSRELDQAYLPATGLPRMGTFWRMRDVQGRNGRRAETQLC